MYGGGCFDNFICPLGSVCLIMQTLQFTTLRFERTLIPIFIDKVIFIFLSKSKYSAIDLLPFKIITFNKIMKHIFYSINAFISLLYRYRRIQNNISIIKIEFYFYYFISIVFLWFLHSITYLLNFHKSVCCFCKKIYGNHQFLFLRGKGVFDILI